MFIFYRKQAEKNFDKKFMFSICLQEKEFIIIKLKIWYAHILSPYLKTFGHSFRHRLSIHLPKTPATKVNKKGDNRFPCFKPLVARKRPGSFPLINIENFADFKQPWIHFLDLCLKTFFSITLSRKCLIFPFTLPSSSIQRPPPFFAFRFVQATYSRNEYPKLNFLPPVEHKNLSILLCHHFSKARPSKLCTNQGYISQLRLPNELIKFSQASRHSPLWKFFIAVADKVKSPPTHQFGSQMQLKSANSSQKSSPYFIWVWPINTSQPPRRRPIFAFYVWFFDNKASLRA